jgi:shikimate dehydrogenase
MKLGLLGYPLTHSRSPVIYKNLLGNKLSSYELFSYQNTQDIPQLDYFSSRLDGLNITSPYKTHFFNQVVIESDLVRRIGAVNTLAFSGQGIFGTNTDVLAVEEILTRYQKQFPKLQLVLLGSGVMAEMTKLTALQLKLPLIQYSRKNTADFLNLNLKLLHQRDVQTIIINACSRDYVFHGELSGAEIFLDYNYSFIPHQTSLPSRLMAYHDGQEMLELQAKAAVTFWQKVIPKLK